MMVSNPGPPSGIAERRNRPLRAERVRKLLKILSTGADGVMIADFARQEHIPAVGMERIVQLLIQSRLAVMSGDRLIRTAPWLPEEEE
jgi:hypothetical protein